MSDIAILDKLCVTVHGTTHVYAEQGRRVLCMRYVHNDPCYSARTFHTTHPCDFIHVLTSMRFFVVGLDLG